MLGHQYGSGNGLPASARAAKVYRGSRKRVRRIKWRGNTSVELWIVVVLMLFVLCVGIPWLIKHPPVEHSHHLMNE
jgi:hypothetical protein